MTSHQQRRRLHLIALEIPKSRVPIDKEWKGNAHSNGNKQLYIVALRKLPFEKLCVFLFFGILWLWMKTSAPVFLDMDKTLEIWLLWNLRVWKTSLCESKARDSLHFIAFSFKDSFQIESCSLTHELQKVWFFSCSKFHVGRHKKRKKPDVN